MKKRILCVTEGAVMIALAFVLELLCVWLNAATGVSALLPFGGTITVSMLPIAYYSFRRGIGWGVGVGLIYSFLQMMLGFYVPPANTWWAVALCVLLDYVIAFSVVGMANLFVKPFGKHRLVGYGVGAVAVCLIRFVCSFLSGVILWGSYAPEGMNVWLYSLVYNASYMIPNAILTGILAVVVCAALDPVTLKRMQKKAE
ncbi:MAG: energy-coupled thiamine transporter ThiT [Ruminococcaceae bacterium]|nr:energy-coupled thiamine transporter ThiT [Oscillospiraceae bacterium]